MDVKEQLRREIEALKGQREALDRQIDARRRAIEALQQAEANSGNESLRFYHWRPLDAMRELLRENGSKMKRDELMQLLLDGGIAVDRKRSAHNVRISVEKNLVLGNLIALKDDYIDLPERHLEPNSKGRLPRKLTFATTEG